MIKPENLRIGDLVRVCCNCSLIEGTVCAVTEIDFETVSRDKKCFVSLNVPYDNDDGACGVWCCNIEGVPITPDILKQNDFDDKYLGVIFTKAIDRKIRHTQRRIYIVHYSSEWRVFLEHESRHDSVLISSVKYVHQLQHILCVLNMDTNLKI